MDVWRLISFGEEEILRVLAANRTTAEERLKELAQWHFERLMNTSRACVGTAVAFIAVIVVSQFKGELRVGGEWIAIAMIAAGAVATFGLFTYWRLRRHAKLYARALEHLRGLP